MEGCRKARAIAAGHPYSKHTKILTAVVREKITHTQNIEEKKNSITEQTTVVLTRRPRTCTHRDRHTERHTQRHTHRDTHTHTQRHTHRDIPDDLKLTARQSGS